MTRFKVDRFTVLMLFVLAVIFINSNKIYAQSMPEWCYDTWYYDHELSLRESIEATGTIKYTGMYTRYRFEVTRSTITIFIDGRKQWQGSHRFDGRKIIVGEGYTDPLFLDYKNKRLFTNKMTLLTKKQREEILKQRMEEQRQFEAEQERELEERELAKRNDEKTNWERVKATNDLKTIRSYYKSQSPEWLESSVVSVMDNLEVEALREIPSNNSAEEYASLINFLKQSYSVNSIAAQQARNRIEMIKSYTQSLEIAFIQKSKVFHQEYSFVVPSIKSSRVKKAQRNYDKGKSTYYDWVVLALNAYHNNDYPEARNYLAISERERLKALAKIRTDSQRPVIGGDWGRSQRSKNEANYKLNAYKNEIVDYFVLSFADDINIKMGGGNFVENITDDKTNNNPLYCFSQSGEYDKMGRWKEAIDKCFEAANSGVASAVEKYNSFYQSVDFVEFYALYKLVKNDYSRVDFEPINMRNTQSYLGKFTTLDPESQSNIVLSEIESISKKQNQGVGSGNTFLDVLKIGGGIVALIGLSLLGGELGIF